MTDSRFTPQTREQPEPHESSRPVPRLVLTVIGLLLLWAVYHLYSSFSPIPSSLGDKRVAADFAVPVTANGAQLYTANCVACHQANGAGVSGVFPPLSGSEWVKANDPDPVIRILLHGVNGPLTVSGLKYNGLMPPFGDKFSDAEIAALVNHVRTHFGNSASETDARYVAKVRAQTEEQTGPWKGDEDLLPLLNR